MHNNQNGLSSIQMILLVIVVVVIGLISWFAWQASQDQQANTTQNSAANATYLTLEEFKVRIPLNDKTSGLTLAESEPSAIDASDISVMILATELDGGWICESHHNNHKGNVGSISVTAKTERSEPFEPLASKKVGNTTYGFEAGGDGCTDDPLYQELVDAFTVQFEQLEAY